MAGFFNDIVHAINIDLSGQFPPAATLVSNGQMLIGSTTPNAGGTNVNVGTITSPLGTLNISYSSPNITIDLAGSGTAVQRVGVDTGVNPISPVGGVINISGSTTGLQFNGVGNSANLTGTLVVANGGTGRASATAYMPLVGGTTTTAAQQSVSAGTTAGQVLAYQGASSVPTFASAILGSVTGTLPGAGFMGQNVNSTYSSVSIGTSVAQIATISITAGNWLISANIEINGGANTSMTAAISGTTASLTPIIGGGATQVPTSATIATTMTFPGLPYSTSSTVSIYLNASCGASSNTVQGILTATRIG